MAVILWNKKYTETLSQTIERFRLEMKDFQNEKVTYAGRLDPMAEGLLILLTGNDVYKKKEFLHLPKTYDIDFFFGVSTDTYDILGFITDIAENIEGISDNTLQRQLEEYLGEYNQAYPPYSSKTVQGKPLFTWAREGNIARIQIPTKKVEIFNIQFLKKKSIPISLFEKKIKQSVLRVVGDFRQKNIIEKWEIFFKNNTDEYIELYTIRVTASSGTYMRNIIHRLGEDMSTLACSLKITRLQIGDYVLENS